MAITILDAVEDPDDSGRTIITLLDDSNGRTAQVNVATALASVEAMNEATLQTNFSAAALAAFPTDTPIKGLTISA